MLSQANEFYVHVCLMSKALECVLRLDSVSADYYQAHVHWYCSLLS